MVRDSRGVLVMVRDNLHFQLRSMKVDSQGRYVFLEVSIQDSPYFLLNIYAPNKCSEQCTFFKEISEILKAARTEQDYPIIVGGDFNVILDPDLDGRGGNNRKKDSAILVEDMHLDFDLVDIWRIRNPTTSRFTWRQKTPVVQRRLDFWLISDSLQDEIISAEIKTSIKTDHSAITLSICGLDETERGPNFWKFNSNLVNDSDYCELLTTEYVNWLEEFKEVQDKRVLWDLIKYKIRQRTITYSKGKARERRAKLQKVEDKLKKCTEKCDIDPTIVEISRNWSAFKQNMIKCTITLHKGQSFALGQPGMKWVKKITNIFLNLENSNKTKSSDYAFATL